MLNDKGVAFTYREYTKDPLSADELRDVLGKLGLTAHDVLRGRDAKKAGIDGASTSEDALIEAMAGNPNLLQRPIAVLGGKAAVGRPVENILEVL